jgi:hypothetical protein
MCTKRSFCCVPYSKLIIRGIIIIASESRAD